MSAADRILARAQANPHLAEVDATFLADLVARAQGIVVAYCRLGSFPDGDEAVPVLEDAAVILTEALATKAGTEGLASASLPHGVSFTEAAIDPRAEAILQSKRRLWP